MSISHGILALLVDVKWNDTGAVVIGGNAGHPITQILHAVKSDKENLNAEGRNSRSFIDAISSPVIDFVISAQKEIDLKLKASAVDPRKQQAEGATALHFNEFLEFAAVNDMIDGANSLSSRQVSLKREGLVRHEKGDTEIRAN